MSPRLPLFVSSLIGAAALLVGLSACDSTPPPAESNNAPVVPASQEITLESGCNSCHGRNGVGNNPEVPFIAGQHATYLESAMRAYLIGDRKHDVMRAAVFDLEVAERHQLAEHYAQLDSRWASKVVRTPRGSAEDNARDIRAGKTLSQPCAGCHGKDGNSIKEGVPSLAGLQPEYFIPALKSYLQGKRQGAAIMKNFKLSLSQRDIRRLAAFFAAQKRQRSPLGKRLNAADASDALAHRCLGCHGDDGNSTHPAIPTLAGQNAAYLMKAMQTYRDNKRQNAMMADVAHGLSDEAIRRNAIYFATRTPQVLPNQNTAQHGATKTGMKKFSPMSDGKQLAASCNGCHGKNGNSTTAGVPRLAGLAQAYLQDAIRHYRDGNRQHGMMKMLTRYLSDTDIEKIALYYASQTPAHKAGKPAADGELASSCAGCHGEDGNSSVDTTPSLAGQNADYIVSALRAYKTGTRPHNEMKDVAVALDKQTMRKLADYYSRLAPKSPTVRTMEAPKVLAQKCDRCHGKNGGEPDPDKPRIAGQRQAYLIKALTAYKNKERINSMMYNMTVELSRVEIEAIAAYYSQQ